MLDKTTNTSQQQREDEGFYAGLKAFDPEVHAVIFWPAMVGVMVVALSVAVSSYPKPPPPRPPRPLPPPLH